MYSIGALLQKEPAAIAAALKSVLFVAVLAGLVVIDAEVLAGIALAAELILSLFVRNVSTPVAAPTLPSGTEVAIKGTEDKTTV